MSKIVVVVLVSFLSACSMGRTAMPPVIDNTSQAPAGQGGGSDDVQTFPLPADEADIYRAEPLEDAAPIPIPDRGGLSPSSPQPRQGNNAVVALLDKADQYGQSGNSDAAADTLERALRIEPRNARLWSKLAAVRLQQGQSEQAEQLALKSNALSRHNRQLQMDNWRIVAKARWARNDQTGAQSAEQKVSDFERYYR